MNNNEAAVVIRDGYVSDKLKPINNFARFHNNYWFYGDHNVLYYTLYNNPTYIPENSYDEVGDSSRITSLCIVSDDILAVYKVNKSYLVSQVTVNDNIGYGKTELKTDMGHVPIGQALVTTYSNIPVVLNNQGVFGMYQSNNIATEDHIYTPMSDAINPRLLLENASHFMIHNHRFLTYFVVPIPAQPREDIPELYTDPYTKIYVLDNRTGSWFY